MKMFQDSALRHPLASIGYDWDAYDNRHCCENCISRTLHIRSSRTDRRIGVSSQGETSIRKLLSRGVGLDSNLVIGASEEEEGGSTVIAVATELHNDEVTEFPLHLNQNWLN